MLSCLSNATTWFDLWSVQHFAVAAAVAQTYFSPTNGIVRYVYHEKDLAGRTIQERVLIGLIVLLILNFLLNEILIHLNAPHVPPFWGNSLITDPLLIIAGYLLSLRTPLLTIPAIILALFWPIIILSLC
jgi:hypothetical protein